MTETYRDRLLVQAAAPDVEPLTLAEAKLYLRVDTTAEDALITDLIAVARQAAERHLRRSLITQQWTLAYDECLPMEVRLPMPPVQEIVRVTLVDKDGGTEDVDESLYHLNAARTKLVFEQILSAHQVEIVYQTGYGDDATDVPPGIVQGMMAHIAELYDGRSRALPVPPSAIALYQPYQEMTL